MARIVCVVDGGRSVEVILVRGAGHGVRSVLLAEVLVGCSMWRFLSDSYSASAAFMMSQLYEGVGLGSFPISRLADLALGKCGF